MSSLFIRRYLAVVVAVSFCTSCQSNSRSTESTTRVETTVSTTRTTVPWKPGAATKAWVSWIKTFDYVDSSVISKSECGVYAMLITTGSLTFYDWNGVMWTDISTQLSGGHGQDPTKIYTQDFTNDGILDFFVTYSDQKKSGGPLYGAYFAFPWSGDNRCEWGWVDIDNGRDLTKTINSPTVDARHAVVSASGYASGRWKITGEIQYSSSRSSFVFQQF